MSIGRILLLTAAGFVLLLVFVPGFRNGVTERLTSLSSSSETITVPASPIQGSRLQPSSDGNPPTSVGGNLKLITLLGFDAIPAILDPEFVDVGGNYANRDILWNYGIFVNSGRPNPADRRRGG